MKLQLKRSNQLVGGKAKQPDLATMDYGELAVNYNATDPVIFLRNSSDQIIRITAVGIPDMEDSNIQPGTLDDRYVNIIGDTMQGDLVLHADPDAAMKAATKQYVDTQIADIDIPSATEVGPTPPDPAGEGQLWWCDTDGRLYVYYTDSGSSQWVPATPETENDYTFTPDGGIEVDNNFNVSIKIRPGYGVSTSSLGLQIGDDWSNIPLLPE